MDQFQLNKFKEADIDAVITAAGGRGVVFDHSITKELAWRSSDETYA